MEEQHNNIIINNANIERIIKIMIVKRKAKSFKKSSCFQMCSNFTKLSSITVVICFGYFFVLCTWSTHLKKQTSYVSQVENTLSYHPTITDTMKPDDFVNSTIHNHQMVYHKPYQYFEYDDFPCITFIKIHKCASTTVKYALSRLIRNRGGCETSYDHTFAYTMNLSDRDKVKKSYLVTFVRDPTTRAISDFFYHGVTKGGKEPSLENFKKINQRLRQHKLRGLGGFQLSYVSIEHKHPEYFFWNESSPKLVQHPSLLLSSIQNVIKEYDFIGVAERVDESLVVLSFLLDVKVEELATISRRVSGQFIDLSKEKKCVKIAKPNMTKDMTDYVESEEWRASTAGDRILHKVAIERLDYTIDHLIGRQLFEQRLKDFKVVVDSLKSCRKFCSICSIEGQYRDNPKDACSKCQDIVTSKWRKRALSRNS